MYLLLNVQLSELSDVLAVFGSGRLQLFKLFLVFIFLSKHFFHK